MMQASPAAGVPLPLLVQLDDMSYILCRKAPNPALISPEALEKLLTGTNGALRSL